MIIEIKEWNLIKNNKTPLHIARNPPSWTGLEKAVKLLVSKGSHE